MTETTAVETTTGECLMVVIDDTEQTVTFLDDDGRTHVRTYGYLQFARLAGALALDIDNSLTISAATVAGIQQYADLDAHGQRARAAR